MVRADIGLARAIAHTLRKFSDGFQLMVGIFDGGIRIWSILGDEIGRMIRFSALSS